MNHLIFVLFVSLLFSILVTSTSVVLLNLSPDFKVFLLKFGLPLSTYWSLFCFIFFTSYNNCTNLSLLFHSLHHINIIYTLFLSIQLQSVLTQAHTVFTNIFLNFQHHIHISFIDIFDIWNIFIINLLYVSLLLMTLKHLSYVFSDFFWHSQVHFCHLSSSLPFHFY